MASCNISVIIPINSITMSQSVAELRVEKTMSLSVTIDPPDTTEDKTVTWSSSDNNIASVDSEGTVTAIYPGNVVITAKVGTHTTSCIITVKPKITATIIDPTDKTAGGYGTYTKSNGIINMSLKGNGKVGSWGDQTGNTAWVENSKAFSITVKFSEPIAIVDNQTILSFKLYTSGGNETPLMQHSVYSGDHYDYYHGKFWSKSSALSARFPTAALWNATRPTLTVPRWIMPR